MFGLKFGRLGALQSLVSLIPQDFIGFYSMDNISGSTVIDDGSSGADLAIVGGATPVPGYIGDAMQFNGSTGKLVGGAGDFSFERTNSFSISFWINFDAVPSTFQVLMNKQEASPGRRGWTIRNGGAGDREKLRFDLTNTDGSNLIAVQTNNNVFTADWTHVLITYDGSSDASGINIYVDNVSQPWSAITNSLSGTIISTANFALGARDVDNGGFTDGLMDQVRLYNRILTADERSYLFNE